MLYGATHRRFTKNLFPFIHTGLIDNVNRHIDNPSIYEYYFNSMQNQRYKNQGLRKNPFDIFGLTQSGHRKYNHDVLTGMMLGSIQATKMGLPPSQGMMAAISHYATDSLSNRMVRTMGTEGRNIFEALMGMSYRRRNQRYPSTYY